MGGWFGINCRYDAVRHGGECAARPSRRRPPPRPRADGERTALRAARAGGGTHGRTAPTRRAGADPSRARTRATRGRTRADGRMRDGPRTADGPICRRHPDATGAIRRWNDAARLRRVEWAPSRDTRAKSDGRLTFGARRATLGATGKSRRSRDLLRVVFVSPRASPARAGPLCFWSPVPSKGLEVKPTGAPSQRESEATPSQKRASGRKRSERAEKKRKTPVQAESFALTSEQSIP